MEARTSSLLGSDDSKSQFNSQCTTSWTSPTSSRAATNASTTFLFVEITCCTCCVDANVLTDIFRRNIPVSPVSVQCGPSFSTTIGYVEYQDAATAHRVMVQLQGQRIYDEGCILNISVPDPIVTPSTLAPSAQIPPLSLPAGYTFQQQLSGDGCMSLVVKALDERRAQVVVLKHATCEENHKYIERELAILQQCEAHPHVLQLVEKELVDDWLVVEHMEGGSFETECEVPQKLTHEEVLEIAAATADALAFLHGLGIVHRDVKPHNIFFDRDEWYDNKIASIKLADMGLAKQLPHGVSEVSFAGTKKYAPPEALQNRAGPASDMWSWACTVAQLATGVKPYEGDNKDIPYSTELKDTELFVELYDLLGNCFAQQTPLRPSAAHVDECCKQFLDNQSEQYEVSSPDLHRSGSIPMHRLQPSSHHASTVSTNTPKIEPSQLVSQEHKLPAPTANHGDPFSEANCIDRAAARANEATTHFSKTLSESTPPNSCSNGSVALMNAFSKGQAEVVKRLLDHGAPVDAVDESGDTALMKACFNASLAWCTSEDLEVVNVLLAAGAAVDAANRHGNTALMTASSGGHPELVNILLDHGAAVDAVNRHGETALTMACGAEVVNILLDHGAAVDVVDRSGHTALMNACVNGHAAVVNILLDHGAAVDVASRHAETALINACFNGHAAVVNILLDHGAAVDVVDRSGHTALMNACVNGHAAVVNILLDHGAAVDAVNRHGETALMKASLRGRAAVVNILLGAGVLEAQVDVH